ncbi:1,4-dihydroxy-2-naphthoate octaprenyltransferase [Cephaloticoccus primus]|uniref:1,4-dihydroxy-2-naphthoate octaprenyltransferase n=1 Tax=Cephaloticoccus primus TaxID=1548207 RepID=A0A139SPU8_9BACT|nr:1,4-dihydroxy-2-naphthoate octaprenyltransferase [Cephaloticoccus primus]
MEAARPKTLPAAIAPVLVGSALAWHDGGFDWRAAALCAAFSLLMQIGANFANDYYDFIKGGDTAARVGPRRAVVAGLVAPATMRRAMWLVFAVATALGLLLVAWGGWGLAAIGAVSVLCAIAYTGGPYPLAYHGLGDVFVLIFFGPVAVGGTYYVQAGALDARALIFSLPVGLLAANILVLNNYRDEAEDRQVGKRTTVVRFGKKFACAQFGAAFILSFALPVVAVALAGASVWLLLPLVLIPEAWRQQRTLRTSRDPSELISLLGASGRFLGLYALLLAIGLLLA